MRTAEPPSRDGLLLEHAYQNAVAKLRTGEFAPRAVLEPSFALARLVSDNAPLSRRARSSAQERVTTLAGGDEAVDINRRYDAIETRTVSESLQRLRAQTIRVEGQQTPTSQIAIFNDRVEQLVPRIRGVLTRTEGTGDLVFPDNSADPAVEAVLEQAGVNIHTLFDRRLTSEEELRFYENQPDLIARRNSVIDTLEEVGQLRTGVAEIVNYPARLLNGRQLTDLNQQELVDYADLVYATIMTINTLGENPQSDEVRASYDRFIDEATGTSITSEYIRRRVHERVTAMRA